MSRISYERRVAVRVLFLAALLDALTTCVQRSLSACLCSHLLSRLLLWLNNRVSKAGQRPREKLSKDVELHVPALFFSWKARSSSSSSLVAFLAALRGLAFPPVYRCQQHSTRLRMIRCANLVCRRHPFLLDWLRRLYRGSISGQANGRVLGLLSGRGSTGADEEEKSERRGAPSLSSRLPMRVGHTARVGCGTPVALLSTSYR